MILRDKDIWEPLFDYLEDRYEKCRGISSGRRLMMNCLKGITQPSAPERPLSFREWRGIVGKLNAGFPGGTQKAMQDLAGKGQEE